MTRAAAATPSRPAFGLPGRIQAPNAQKRALALIGLGAGGAAMARGVGKSDLGAVDVTVVCNPPLGGGHALEDIKTSGDDLHRAVREADMIFIVACRGDDVALAPVVSRLAHERNAPVTAIYLVPPDLDTGMPTIEDQTLKTLRSGVEMLVIASDESYVTAMVAALGG